MEVLVVVQLQLQLHKVAAYAQISNSSKPPHTEHSKYTLNHVQN